MTKDTTTPTIKSEKEAPSVIVPNTVVTITIPWSAAEPEYIKARAKVARTVKVPGFRQGKVPPDVAEKMAGNEKIIDTALDVLLPKFYAEAIKKEKKAPLTQPQFRGVKIEAGSDWVIAAEIAEKPEIKLGDYKKIVKEAKKHAVEKIAEENKAITEGNKKLKDDEKPRPAVTEEQQKDFTLQHIYQHLAEETKPQVAELLVRREVEYELDQLARQLQSVNFTFQQYLERRQMTEQQLSQQMAMAAVGRLQIIFILDEIAKDNKITVSETEIDTYMNEKVEESVRKQYAQSAEYRQLVSQTLHRQKVAEQLLAI